MDSVLYQLIDMQINGTLDQIVKQMQTIRKLSENPRNTPAA